MRFRSRAKASVGLSVGVLLAVAGCGSSGSTKATNSSGSCTSSSASATWKQIVSKATTEGSVTLYTIAQQTTLAQLQPAFQKACGITLSIFRGNTGQVITRLNADKQSGTPGADVVMVNIDATPSTLSTYDTQGRLATPAGPNFKDPQFEAAMQGNYFDVYGVVFGWAWNTQLLPGGIHSWKDFLSPKLANGKIGALDPSNTGTNTACYKDQAQASGDPNYLRDLAAQKPRIYPGGEAQENAVAAGELAATAWATVRVNSLKQQGAPVQFAVPPKACMVPLQAGIIKNSPHPDAAQVFANWLAGPEAQAILLQSGTPARSGVPGNTIDFASLKPTIPDNPAQQSAFLTKFNSLFHP
jgi:iron(III) transport system substrate-binding protein